MAFIHKISDELISRLEEIGYKHNPNYDVKDGTCLCISSNTGSYFIRFESDFYGRLNWKDDAGRIDCNTDDEKFIEIAKYKYQKARELDIKIEKYRQEHLADNESD